MTDPEPIAREELRLATRNDGMKTGTRDCSFRVRTLPSSTSRTVERADRAATRNHGTWE